MSPNILVVDDSKVISESIKELIEVDLGFNCVIADSLKQTAKLLLEYRGKFDIAVLDLKLPDALNGEVVDFVGKFNIPIVVLTSSDITKEHLSNRNIVDYVIKDGQYSFKYTASVVKRIVSNQSTKILIVDDSKIFLEQTKDLALRYKLQVHTASNGEEALDVLKNHNDIKIVLTDYNMPKMDGLELVRQIRKKYSKDELSVIVTSSSEDKNIASKFLKFGANDFIYKGFSSEEFYARLNSNLDILELFSDVKDKANKDYLTGMFNRRYLFDEGNEIFERIKHRKNDSLSVALIDIDKFKKINDTYGHDIGDIAIKEVPKILSSKISSNSLMARLGGEEFCVLVKGREKDKIKAIFENIRKKFEDNIIKTNKVDLKFTVSIGVCLNLKNSLIEMINKADEALYKAKSEGRNRVVYFEN